MELLIAIITVIIQTKTQLRSGKLGPLHAFSSYVSIDSWIGGKKKGTCWSWLLGYRRCFLARSPEIHWGVPSMKWQEISSSLLWSTLEFYWSTMKSYHISCRTGKSSSLLYCLPEETERMHCVFTWSSLLSAAWRVLSLCASLLLFGHHVLAHWNLASSANTSISSCAFLCSFPQDINITKAW